MIGDWREWPSGLRTALVCLVVALALDVAAFTRMRTTPATNVVAPLRIDEVPRIALTPPTDEELVRQAGMRTPFDLVQPPAPLVLSGPTAPLVAPSAVQPRLIGTVVQGQGGFVMVEMPDARMQLVRIGEKVGDLRLRSVSTGEAVFDDPQGARVSLRTPRAGAGVEPRP
jgi:hypothetical protein